eukprot:scaffold233665_cov23-Tisochrysis_lutea.AAC.4
MDRSHRGEKRRRAERRLDPRLVGHILSAGGTRWGKAGCERWGPVGQDEITFDLTACDAAFAPTVGRHHCQPLDDVAQW